MNFELSKNELDKLIDFLDEKTKIYPIILLRGTLGSGKTTLVKEFAKKKGFSEVTSPTFLMQHIYGNKIFHYDLYQVSFEKFLEFGLLDELEKEGIHFIEWGDKELENLLKMAGLKYMVIEIEPKENKRVYKVCIN